MQFSHATVTGNGYFPLDMLRYDTCWPSRQEDASECHSTMGLRPQHHSIQVTTFVKAGRRKPSIDDFTPARWKSFGWTLKFAY